MYRIVIKQLKAINPEMCEIGLLTHWSDELEYFRCVEKIVICICKFAHNSSRYQRSDCVCERKQLFAQNCWLSEEVKTHTTHVHWLPYNYNK